MVNSNRAEDIAAENERSLSTLLRTIARFQGKFSLTLVRCNYASLRYAMLQKLRLLSTVAYQELVLEPATKTLHQTILNAVQEQPPKALIVVGIESVVGLDDLLAGANRARDQFKQDFAFPVILWVTDAVLAKFSRSANDLKSWAPPPIQFTMPIDDLMNVLQLDHVINFLWQTADQAFANVGDFKLDDCEIESLENYLLNLEQTLDPELQASWEFIRGLVEYRKNKIDAAIKHYQQSLAFWQQNFQWEKQGIVCRQIAQAYNGKAELDKDRQYFQQSINNLQQAKRNDLAAKYIVERRESLRLLQAWEELQSLTEKALEIHLICGTPSQVAEDYGFLAEVALQSLEWEKACTLAKLALSVLKESETGKKENGLYLLLLAKGQRNLTLPLTNSSIIASEVNQFQASTIASLHSVSLTMTEENDAIKNLELAKKNTHHQDDVQLYLRILEEFRTLYFEQGEYLKAFDIKLEQQKVKSKYGLQAFIGAGRLQSPQQTIDICLASGQSQAEIIEKVVAASGRFQDIKQIIQRIGRPDSKLTIIYGRSGVGKSSIIQAWLVPALQLKNFEARDVLPVLLQSYYDWARNCGECLKAGIERLKAVNLSGAIDTPTAILEQLRLNQDRNLLTVLIFDQFEEFFFVCKDPAERQIFFDFLRECMNIQYLKIILSLREDYLHYLLEFSRPKNNRDFIKSDILDNILSKDILFHLGNFSLADTRSVISALTLRSHFYLEPELIEELVKDLAGELGEVLPIELQVVGAQLQEEQITTLAQYQELGNSPQQKLVERFLEEVIKDCGPENEGAVRRVLYLLTDEDDIRPLKTRAELASALATFEEADKLDLVLELLVKSGLVFRWTELPAEFYQLVHDYLVSFIRQQRELDTKAEFEELRKLHEINRDVIEQLRKDKELIALLSESRDKQRQAREKQHEAEAKLYESRKWQLRLAILGVILLAGISVMALY